MAFQDLAPELVHQIYNCLPTISDVINLSLTCHRFNHLLRNAQKLSTLFAAADREFGPIEDIKMLVTYNTTSPAHAKRDPPLSYALLRQAIVIGMVGKKFEDVYPTIKWQDDFLYRRMLTNDEARRVRQAIYRYWLYTEAFHNRMHPRIHRLQPALVEERSQLLRNWSTTALIEIEDVRLVMEDILKRQICPTDGVVFQRIGKDAAYSAWACHTDSHSRAVTRVDHMRELFYGAHDEPEIKHNDLSPIEARTMKMGGWGDEISQYYYVQSLLKLNPAQILWLYNHATYKWQVEALVQDMGEDWFWNNGQTFSDTLSRVMLARGEEVEDIHCKIFDGLMGIAAIGHVHDDLCEIDCNS